MNSRYQTCPEVQSCQTLEFVEWTEIRLTRICTRSWSKAGVSAHTKCMSAHGKVQVTETPSVVWLQQWRGSAVSSFHATLENLINWATILITNIQTFFSLTLANFKFDLWQKTMRAQAKAFESDIKKPHVIYLFIPTNITCEEKFTPEQPNLQKI